MSIDIGSRARWSSIPSQVYKQLFIIDIWNRLLSVSPLLNDSRHNRIHRFQSFEWKAEKQFSRSIYCSIFLCSHFIGGFAQDFIWKAFGSQVQNCTCFSLKHCFFSFGFSTCTHSEREGRKGVMKYWHLCWFGKITTLVEKWQISSALFPPFWWARVNTVCFWLSVLFLFCRWP